MTAVTTAHVLFFDRAEPLARAVANCLLFASSDRTTPFLASVKFEYADNVLTCASTDRYRLCVEKIQLNVDHTGTDPFEFMLERDAVASLLTALKTAKRDPITLTLTGNRVQVTTPQSTLEFRTYTDRDFPPYKALIPTEDARAAQDRIGFNPKFLADLGKVATADKAPVVTIEFFGKNKPTLIQYSDGPLIMLMLIRIPD